MRKRRRLRKRYDKKKGGEGAEESMPKNKRGRMGNINKRMGKKYKNEKYHEIKLRGGVTEEEKLKGRKTKKMRMRTEK